MIHVQFAYDSVQIELSKYREHIQNDCDSKSTLKILPFLGEGGDKIDVFNDLATFSLDFNGQWSRNGTHTQSSKYIRNVTETTFGRK